MRFFGYTLGDPATPIEPPTPELMADMGKFMEEAAKAGVIVAAGGFGPPEEGTRVSLADGKYTVIDGPFTEAKELIAGYWLIQVKSKEEAIEWAKRAPMDADGHDAEVELRPLFELEDFAPSPTIERLKEIGAQIGKK